MATATRSTGEKKDVDTLVRLIKRNGFNVVPAGSGHKKVVGKNGRPVVDSNGPVIISSSPSDGRWRTMTVKRLMAAKVLTADPWESSQKADTSGKAARLTDPEVRERARLSQLAQHKERQEKTQQLRARFEPFVMKLGGWEKSGVTTQVATTAFGYLASRNRVENFVSLSAATQSLRSLRLGNTLREAARVAWSLFMDDIEAAEDPVARYFQIQREVKGLPPEATTNGNGEGALVHLPLKGGGTLTPPGGPVPPPRASAGIRPYTKPTLALEVVYHATAGRENPDFDAVMKLGERVLALELGEEQ
jgi:hypothetical protein